MYTFQLDGIKDKTTATTKRRNKQLRCVKLSFKRPRRRKEKGQDDGVDPLRVFVVRIYSIPYDFVIKVNLLALMSAFECPARGHYKPNLIFQQENEKNYCRIAGALYLYVRHV
jgi:hypothetical protein